MKRTIRRMAGFVTMLALLVALAPAVPASETAGVNINTASEEELVSLPGIGPSKAKAIVEYRSAHPFKSTEELMNVRGIGEKTFETLKDKITVGAAPASSAKR